MRRGIPLFASAALGALLSGALLPTPASGQQEPPPTPNPPRGVITRVPPQAPGSGRSTVERIPPEEGVAPGTNRRDTSSDKRGDIGRRIEREDASTAGRIQAGEQVRSELDRSDPRADDRSHYEEWTYRGRPGTRVTITLESGAFDTFLVWGRRFEGEFQGLAADDDGGEGVDSRLTVWVRDDREYVIRANSYDGATGRYTLFVSEADPRPDPGAPRGDIAAGQTRRGELGPGDALAPDGTYWEVWTYRGTPGQRIRISAASAEFDTVLRWAVMVGSEPVGVLGDDDGGEGTNSEVTAVVNGDGEYAVVVGAMGPGQTGSYTVRVEPADR